MDTLGFQSTGKIRIRVDEDSDEGGFENGHNEENDEAKEDREDGKASDEEVRYP